MNITDIIIAKALAGGGGGGDLIKINCEYNQDVGYVLDKTFGELYEMCKTGKIVYFAFVEDEEFTTLDDSYAYVANIYTLSKVYKYDTAYRVCFNSSSSTNVDNNTVGAPSTIVFSCNNSEGFPIYYDCIATNTPYLVGTNFPW